MFLPHFNTVRLFAIESSVYHSKEHSNAPYASVCVYQ